MLKYLGIEKPLPIVTLFDVVREFFLYLFRVSKALDVAEPVAVESPVPEPEQPVAPVDLPITDNISFASPIVDIPLPPQTVQSVPLVPRFIPNPYFSHQFQQPLFYRVF